MKTNFEFIDIKKENYFPLTEIEPAITCPHCKSYSGQKCVAIYPHAIGADMDHHFPSLDIFDRDEAAKEYAQAIYGRSLNDLEQDSNFNIFKFKVYNAYILVSQCNTCKKNSIWYKSEYFEELLFPKSSSLNLVPNDDLSSEAKKDFNEAISVLDISPRSSAALARLTLERMLKDQNVKGENINQKIQSLVDGGLSDTIQQSLDIVRVVGNNAVHPGEMDITDDKYTATTILTLINVIAETLITIPKQVKSVYMTLPESSRKAIEKRSTKK